MKAYIEAHYCPRCPECGGLMPRQRPRADDSNQIEVACMNMRCSQHAVVFTYEPLSVELTQVREESAGG